MAGLTSNTVTPSITNTGSGGAQVYNPATGTWSSYTPPPVSNVIDQTTGQTAPGGVLTPSPITVSNPVLTSTNISSTPPAQTAITNAQTNTATASSPTSQYTAPIGPTPTGGALASQVISPSIASGTGSQVLGTSSTTPTTGVTQSSALNTQAATSAGGVESLPAFQTALSNYNAAIANYAALQTQLGQFNASETGTGQTGGVVLGQEGQASYGIGQELQAAATQASQYQAEMQTLVNAYSAQTQAQNQTTTQTQPTNQFTQVSPGNVAVNSSGQPVVSAPVYEPIGQYAPLSPTPAGTTGNTAVGAPTPATTGATPTVQGTSATGTATAGEAGSYTIQSGDTFDSIAAANNTTAAALEAANPGMTATDLQIGAQMTIPAPTSSPFQGGVVQAEVAAGQSVGQQQIALSQAETIQGSINTLLAANPNINSSPTAAVNALNQWVNSTQIPSGPYVAFLQDLQEYANTIAPVLGVGGTATDLKTSIATAMIPTLTSGGTLTQALANLDTLAKGKINAAIKAGGSLGQPSGGTSGTSAGGGVSSANMFPGLP